jgi:acetyl esterase/lipase
VEITPGPDVNGVWIQPRPDLVLFEDIQHAQEVNRVRNIQVPGYWYDKEGVTPDNSGRPVPGEKFAYFIHGGALLSDSAHPSESYSRNPKDLHHCPSVKRVFTLEYRLLRTLPFVEGSSPVMVLDSLKGYMHLIELGFAPEDIILVGDSAGGNLALLLCRYLIEFADEK